MYISRCLYLPKDQVHTTLTSTVFVFFFLLIILFFQDPLRSTPTVGNILGGTVILLAGPCFSQTEDILCIFDGSIEVPGFHYSENFSYCVSPYFENSGWKDLRVTLWPADGGMMPVYTGSSRFYAS